MKKLFLDSAIFSDIDKLVSCRIKGVTTNPSLISKNLELNRNKDEHAFDFYLRFLKQLSLHIPYDTHLSVEVISNDTNEMYRQANEIKEYLNWQNNSSRAIKIPVTLDNLNVINKLAKNDFHINATACINVHQAKMAAEAGAKYVSFFYRRGLDAKEDMIENIKSFRSLYKENIEVICGSIREPYDITDCWNAGADIVTVPIKVIENSLKHEQTDKAIEGFTKDIESWLK